MKAPTGQALQQAPHSVGARHGQADREDAHRAADVLDVWRLVLRVLPVPAGHGELHERERGHGPAREGEYLGGRGRAQGGSEEAEGGRDGDREAVGRGVVANGGVQAPPVAAPRAPLLAAIPIALAVFVADERCVPAVTASIPLWPAWASGKEPGL